LKPSLVADLRGEQIGSRVGARRWTLRDGLVAGQMAVTAMLLVVAALLTRSLMAAQRTNVGLPVDQIAVVSMDTGMLRYSEDRSRQFYDEAQARIRAIAGVESVALATRVPFSLNYNRWEIWVPERHQAGGHGDTVEVTTVSPEYFKTVGVAIVDGRGFTADDRPETARVAVISETFARRYWPGERAVGKTIRSRTSEGPVFEIVGVAADHKVLSVTEQPTPLLHVARIQRPNSYSAVVARTRGNATTLLRDMRRELLALEPNLVFVENQTMAAEAEATLFPARATAWLVSGVGLVAMMLAAIGLYGVIAYSVARRTREIGIRMALGSDARGIVRLVLHEGLGLVLVGFVAGMAGALALRGVIASQLYGVGPLNPIVILAVTGVLALASLAACLGPARRAARVDPVNALRA
jgi:predicted permease